MKNERLQKLGGPMAVQCSVNMHTCLPSAAPRCYPLFLPHDLSSRTATFAASFVGVAFSEGLNGFAVGDADAAQEKEEEEEEGGGFADGISENHQATMRKRSLVSVRLPSSPLA